MSGRLPSDSLQSPTALPAPPLSLRDLLVARQPRLVVTPVIIAANVTMFAAMAAAAGEMAFAPSTLVRWGGEFAPAIAGGEWWRLLSSMWLHAHPLHLLLNAVMLWQLGAVVERLLGPFTFAVCYLLCGAVAAVASLQALPRVAVSAGASGAIFGMVGVLLAVAFVSRRTPGLSTLIGELRIRLLATVVSSLMLGLLLPAIDNAAHAGGLAAGLAFGRLAWRDGVSRAAPWRRTLLPIALTAAIAAGAVRRLDGHENLRTEMARFEALHTRAEADFHRPAPTWRAGGGPAPTRPRRSSARWSRHCTRRNDAAPPSGSKLPSGAGSWPATNGFGGCG